MNKQTIQVLYKYNQWVNAKILSAASNLTVEQFIAPAKFPYGGIRSTLTHVLTAEWIWRKRWEGVSLKAGFNPEDFPTVESLQIRWVEEEKELLKFVDAVTDEQLNSPFQYASTDGVKYENILWESMSHVINHGTQHRAEVAAMLTEFGHSPGDIDMILFLRKKL